MVDLPPTLEDGDFWLPDDVFREINELGVNGVTDDNVVEARSNQPVSPPLPPQPPPPPPPLLPQPHLPPLLPPPIPVNTNGAPGMQVYGAFSVAQYPNVSPAFRNRSFPTFNHYYYYPPCNAGLQRPPPPPFPFCFPVTPHYYYQAPGIGGYGVPAAGANPPGTGVFFPHHISSTTNPRGAAQSRGKGAGVFQAGKPKKAGKKNNVQANGKIPNVDDEGKKKGKEKGNTTG